MSKILLEGRKCEGLKVCGKNSTWFSKSFVNTESSAYVLCHYFLSFHSDVNLEKLLTSFCQILNSLLHWGCIEIKGIPWLKFKKMQTSDKCS